MDISDFGERVKQRQTVMLEHISLNLAKALTLHPQSLRSCFSLPVGGGHNSQSFSHVAKRRDCQLRNSPL